MQNLTTTDQETFAAFERWLLTNHNGGIFEYKGLRLRITSLTKIN